MKPSIWHVGGYIKDIHCHLNLASGIDNGNHFLPLSDEYKNSIFCSSGEFTSKCHKMDYLKYCKVVYKELESQYLEFIKATNGKANYNHVDFHFYGNLTPPVAVAYRKLISKYHIKTARYYGEHHKLAKSIKQKIKLRLADLLSGNKAYAVQSCNIDFYLTQKDTFQFDETIELYVHPDYVNGVLLDNTVSVFGHEKLYLKESIERLNSSGRIQMISWADM